MKPYYDPKTRETYRKVNFSDTHFKFTTGSVELIGNLKIEKNEFGQTTKVEKINTHYVCCGVDKCFECGRKI